MNTCMSIINYKGRGLYMHLKMAAIYYIQPQATAEIVSFPDFPRSRKKVWLTKQVKSYSRISGMTNQISLLSNSCDLIT